MSTSSSQPATAPAQSAPLLGIGVVNFWGFSPAVDLLAPEDTWSVEGAAALSQALDESSASGEPLDVLVCGGSDARHVLRTLAQRGRHRRMPVNIYVVETRPELVCRQLLMLALVYDNELTVVERSEMVLEVLGNAMLREKTAAVVARKAKELIDLVTDQGGPLAPLVDLSQLKFKHRDELEASLKQWYAGVPFDIAELRDRRLRQLYKERFDYRENLVDWDYSMRLLKISGASVVHETQFRDWRLGGLAFEIRDCVYTHPNRTLAAYTAGRERGQTVARRGYWGDVVNGPFACYGVTCRKRQVFRKVNNTHVRTHHEIAHWNVRALLYELETGHVCRQPVAGGPSWDTAADDEQADAASDPVAEGRLHVPAASERVRVVPVLAELGELASRQRFAGRMRRVWVGIGAQHEIKNLGPLLARDAVITCESSTYLLELRVEQQRAYVEALASLLGSGAGARVCRAQLRHPEGDQFADESRPPPHLTALRGFAGVETTTPGIALLTHLPPLPRTPEAAPPSGPTPQ